MYQGSRVGRGSRWRCIVKLIDTGRTMSLLRTTSIVSPDKIVFSPELHSPFPSTFNRAEIPAGAADYGRMRWIEQTDTALA